MLRRPYNGPEAGNLLLIGCIAVIFVVVYISIRKFDAEAAEVSEARANAIAELHEDGIAAFEGNFYFEFIAFTDILHPRDPEFQTFEAIGIESAPEATVYYLIDPDGYTATLEFTPNGMSTWQPSHQPGTTEYNFNPKHEILYRHFLDGDFSIRFVPIDSN